MKSNEELQKNVIDAINWEPLLNAAVIGVTGKWCGYPYRFCKYLQKSRTGLVAKMLLG
jgi:hypothetical protein